MTALAPLGVAACALAAWCLAPVGEPPPTPGPLICLVDVSESVTRPRPNFVPRVRADLAAAADEARREGRAVLALFFARGSERVFGPASADEFERLLDGRDGAPLAPRASAGRGGASDLGSALAAAEPFLGLSAGLVRPSGSERRAESATSAGEAPPARVRIWTDGCVEGDLAPLARWRAAGVEVDVRELGATRLGDAALRELHLPERVERGVELVARVDLWWAPPGDSAVGRSVELDLELVLVPLGDGSARAAEPARRVQRRVDAPAGGGPLSVDVELGPAPRGGSRVTARVSPPVSMESALETTSSGSELRVDFGAGRDPFPENDRAVGFVRADDALVCGLVGPPELERLLRPPGFPGLVFRRLGPEPSTAELAGVLEELDLLVLWDPLAAGTDLPTELVAEFAGRGGGLLLLHGWSGLSRGAAALEALRPLVPGTSDAPERDVVLLVDGSGSMAGAPFDEVRTAALELAGTVPPGDRLVLRFFTGSLRPPLVLREAGSGAALANERLRALLEARVPGGPTWILDSLEAFVREREAAGRGALVFLLTDGRERGGSGEPAERARAVLARAGPADVELVPVAVGLDADLEFLSMLTGPGAAPRVAGELGTRGAGAGASPLADLFQREVNRERSLEGPLTPTVPEPAPELARAAGLVGRALPELERALALEARPGAEVLLVTGTGEPLLAAWQAVGAGVAPTGRVAEFAALPAAPWAPAWGERSLWADLLRWLGRGPRRTGPAARAVDWRGERRLLVDGLDDDWPGSVAWTARAAGRAPGGERAPLARGVVELAPDGPWGSGARTGPLDPRLELAAGAPGGSAASALELVLAGPDGERVLPWHPGIAPEARPWRRPRTLAGGAPDPAGGPVRAGSVGSSPGRLTGAAAAPRAPRLGAFSLALGLIFLTGAALAGRAPVPRASQGRAGR